MTIDELCETIEALAMKHGWEIDNGNGFAKWNWSSMGSRYTTLERRRTIIDEDGDEYEESQKLKVRASNHATAYCTEDMSFVCEEGKSGGDDHTIEQLESVLAGEFSGK